MRGRVIARTEDGAVILRGEREDVRIANAPPTWRIGELVDHEPLGCAPAGPYPAPGSEVMRMPRARMTAIHERARVAAAVRRFFAERDFLEVETPLLVRSPGLELHLDAVGAGGGYLITSPEYQMKRLLAAGFERIVQLCKCFRAGEHGPHHASEFTMIEWYRAFDSIESIIADTQELVHAVCGDTARVGGRDIELALPWARMTVRDAMATWAGVPLRGDESAPELVALVRAAGIEIADGLAWDDAFFTAFLARVEPALARLDHAIILEDWPAPLAALARRKPADPRVALRFEAYVGGLELANAFDELVDPEEQRARFEAEQRERAARGRAVYPIDAKLIAALAEGLPPSAGIALGFDRLVMLATGAGTIDEVLTFGAAEL